MKYRVRNYYSLSCDHVVEAESEEQAIDIGRELPDNLDTFGIRQFVPHDLRRTVRSRLSALGVDPIVCRKVLGHALDGMDRIYNRHNYLELNVLGT